LQPSRYHERERLFASTARTCSTDASITLQDQIVAAVYKNDAKDATQFQLPLCFDSPSTMKSRTDMMLSPPLPRETWWTRLLRNLITFRSSQASMSRRRRFFCRARSSPQCRASWMKSSATWNGKWQACIPWSPYPLDSTTLVILWPQKLYKRVARASDRSPFKIEIAPALCPSIFFVPRHMLQA
jgi:hypothetical protein